MKFFDLLFSRIDEDKRDPEGGWTFIETIIVIGIVLILTSSVGFVAFRYLDRAKVVTAKSDIENYALALSTYYLDCRTFPSEDQGLNALWEKPSSDSEGWDGPYLMKKPGQDPWGNDYDYTVPGPNGLPFGLRSFGSDGLEGGEGNAKDLSSWED
ncbi:type II secretion system major pseudopilin GspG [Spirochaeta isovalerica]|uniref:General secretion pathway protein G n=1 Tax=Spirochaeta isovalerica TaxID=150 RepID=A0A841R519_9SPIO|nr:type II secretion system major pseudopilin GspG [Spirochaeta isovalerica]MBB6478491.1 general secretion pathway protein G [Spirochaeta isovalerica]